MVHSGQVAFAYDYWADNNDCNVELNCLMPNGVFIPLFVNKTSTFNEIKEVCIFNNFSFESQHRAISQELTLAIIRRIYGKNQLVNFLCTASCTIRRPIDLYLSILTPNWKKYTTRTSVCAT